MRPFLIALAPVLYLLGCGSDPATSSAGASSASGSGTGGGPDIDTFLSAPASCAYTCPSDGCAEATTPYACPALGAWASIPHLDACATWDGSYPVPVKGACTASAPTGEALKTPGVDSADPGLRVLPDGRKNRPAGAEWAFNEADFLGGNTSAIARVPGTSYVLTVDTGPDDHAVRAVDTTLIGSGNPVTAAIKFAPPSYLNSGIAVTSQGRVYVATGFGVVQALTFDPAKGTLARTDTDSLPLPTNADGKPWYASGVAVSPDGKRLVVSSVNRSQLLVFDVDTASPTYKSSLGAADLGSKDTFGVYIDPLDAQGSRAYVPVWGGKVVLEINLDDPAKPKVARSFATDRNPQGIAFLDARWMAVANDFGETISLVDRVTGEATSVPVDFEPGRKGLDVSQLAYDVGSSRLYALLAGINAVGAYDVDLTATPPTLTPAGRLSTSWWPSGIVVAPDGALTVTNLRGHPLGPEPADTLDGDGPSGHTRMRGSVEQIPAPTAADLAAGATETTAAVAVGDEAGYPKVTCPGKEMDFPVPPTNTMGPSPVIKHIFFVVRENKTFDSLLGDIAGVKGDPKYTMKATTAEMDQVWTNFRDLARGFTVADNFYNLAVQSTQGHQWTTYGRATDFCERTWSADLRAIPLCGVGDIGRPEEGSLFEWLGAHDVVYDILGEIVGNPAETPAGHNPIDIHYPGGPVQNIPYNDDEKACYTAGRLRVACDLGTFTYLTLPNDHTIGVSPENPTPETMCSINDEATGMLIDAIAHSPIWASSLIVVTEDDPQSGGDHVDYHRTPLVLISPWVKRGYVSRTHIDVPSLHKLFAHVLGLPYPNLLVEKAGLPLDAFTGTPDYTPYVAKPHAWPIGCGTAASGAEKRLTDSWDFSEPDEQPGLGEQVTRWMRGKQLEKLSPRQEAEIEARKAHDSDD